MLVCDSRSSYVVTDKIRNVAPTQYHHTATRRSPAQGSAADERWGNYWLQMKALRMSYKKQ